MQHPCDETLPCATLSGDEHVSIGRPYTVDQLQYRPHGGRFGNHIWTRLAAKDLVFRFQPLALTYRLAEFELCADDG